MGLVYFQNHRRATGNHKPANPFDWRIIQVAMYFTLPDDTLCIREGATKGVWHVVSSGSTSGKLTFCHIVNWDRPEHRPLGKIGKKDKLCATCFPKHFHLETQMELGL